MDAMTKYNKMCSESSNAEGDEIKAETNYQSKLIEAYNVKYGSGHYI
jgi:hypothetical protein